MENWKRVTAGIITLIITGVATYFGYDHEKEPTVAVYNTSGEKKVDLSNYATKDYVNQVMKSHVQEYHE